MVLEEAVDTEGVSSLLPAAHAITDAQASDKLGSAAMLEAVDADFAVVLSQSDCCCCCWYKASHNQMSNVWRGN